MSFLREPNAEPIPGYRLIEPLGSGGFGEVWKCEAPGGLFKAIKFVYGNLNSLDVDGARAEQELHALDRIKRGPPSLRPVHGPHRNRRRRTDHRHGTGRPQPARLLRGVPGAGPASASRRDQLLRYLRDAAEALDHMNEKHNLQHLDIKPRNLFLISDRVKVADFGLVKHLERSGRSGILGGVTPLYAPPETFSGKISEHSDQYSLAIVYQELLTGQRPFNGKNARQLAAAAHQRGTRSCARCRRPNGPSSPGPCPRTPPSAFPAAWLSSAPCTWRACRRGPRSACSEIAGGNGGPTDHGRHDGRHAPGADAESASAS